MRAGNFLRAIVCLGPCSHPLKRRQAAAGPAPDPWLTRRSASAPTTRDRGSRRPASRARGRESRSSRSSTEKSPLTIILLPAGWPANIGQYEDAPGSPLGGVGRQHGPAVGGLYGLPHLEVPVPCRPRRFSRLVEDLCPLGYREVALLPSPLVEVTARVLDHAPVPPAGLLFHEDRAVPLLREVASDTALILCLSSWNIRSLCHNRYRQDQGDYQCCREH